MKALLFHQQKDFSSLCPYAAWQVRIRQKFAWVDDKYGVS
jgi:predicted 3-demethylubiquinone-9 3-methyltransferase (glyoxalase superfamily)